MKPETMGDDHLMNCIRLLHRQFPEMVKRQVNYCAIQQFMDKHNEDRWEQTAEELQELKGPEDAFLIYELFLKEVKRRGLPDPFQSIQVVLKKK